MKAVAGEVPRWYAIADIATGEIYYTGRILSRAAWELTPGTCHTQADSATQARHLVRAVAAEMRGTWNGWRREGELKIAN